ncbi:MAG: metal-dependent hydrolase, partial [Burkholderiales bacterium]
DIVFTLVSPLAYLYQHRGATHSLLMLPVWALLLAWCASRLDPQHPPWRAYYGVMALGLGIHIWGDLITSYGTQIWAPLSDARVAWSTTFIIDLWFTGIMLVGGLASFVWRRSRVPAAASLVVLLGYTGLQWHWQQEAIDLGRAHARALGLTDARVTALPRPPLPTHWMVIVESADRYDYALVSLSRSTLPARPDPDAGFLTRIAAPYLPAAQAQWVTATRHGGVAEATFAREAWASGPFGFFRWFAVYPVLDRIESRDGARCAWFRDLRFLTPGRGVWPFHYGACQRDGAWRAYEWIDEQQRPEVR